METKPIVVDGVEYMPSTEPHLRAIIATAIAEISKKSAFPEQVHAVSFLGEHWAAIRVTYTEGAERRQITLVSSPVMKGDGAKWLQEVTEFEKKYGG